MTEPVNIAALEQKFNQLMEQRRAIQPAGHGAREGKGKQYLFSFMGEYAQWCYEHRILGSLSKLLIYLALASAITICLWGFAGTGLGKAFGLEKVRDRATFSYYAILWSSRSAAGAERMPIAPSRYSGTIEKVIGDMLVVTYYENGAQLKRLVRPANVIATDKAAFAEWATKYLLKGISIDFYQPLGEVSGHKVWGVVLWYRKNPINVELVEQGIGYPEKNPPTAVVNQIFSQHYWHKARTGR
ncbi:hypothetical protein [Stutzerimonas stutzeri]|uniref:hypothetical protein n=1 Tax=Stutzerimonas stutzeri TaxID=316 RepID=UPI0015E46C1D|nr:hypothetical protein [Stutzerimonas stutzeri]MBA1280200.1 hypothetical protein [Stutzerimonas stutzeri]